MARITVEDCLNNVNNRFELILIASERARQLARGEADPLVAPEGDKPTVIALREVANKLIDKRILEESKSPMHTSSADKSEEISKEIVDETQQTEVELESVQQEDNDATINTIE